MIERRRVMATNNPPYDAEIEYLEGTGTLYIETGIIPNADTGIYINAYSSNNIDSYVVGLRNTTGDTRWCIGHSNGYYYGYNNYNNSRIGANPTELWLNYNNDGLFRSISNSYSLPTLSFTPAYNIRLFGSAGIVASYTSWKGKLYNVKITQGNNLIMDLIPVRKDTTGYMYDKVSGRLFGNSGTGDFILGLDLPITENSYILDGLVFLLDGINKGATDGTWVDLIGGKVFTANNDTYIQSTDDGFVFLGSNAYSASVTNVMTNSTGLVGTTTWTMESACSPTAWGNGYRALFTSSNRGCGLALNGMFHWSSGDNKSWQTNILSQQLTKVTLSLNKDIGLVNGEQLTTIGGGDQMTTSGFRVGTCQNKNHNFDGTIHSIRMYNRSLTLEERLHNLHVDNVRFNLGLNI